MFKLGGTDPEKSYRATFNNDDGDSNENGKKQKRTDQKKQLSVSTCITATKGNCIISRFVEGWTQDNYPLFRLIFWTLIQSFRIQLHKNSSTFDKFNEMEGW